MDVTRQEVDALGANVNTQIATLTGQINNGLPPPVAARIAEISAPFTQIEQWRQGFDALHTLAASQHGILNHYAISHVEALIKRMSAMEQAVATGGGKGDG